ncbi:hypothetical protein D5R93_07190 [Actinomyces lilanjuaniae]|uniref:Uncharacterized protein n=1 Tax=Actinomyces lilanjuaniae TaxID=2321394 RepID=A0ABM6Z3V1_9ACTO|nr:hypothetical protein D5R93_07190 [Actinomyces lilanjuaniae]
MGWCAAAELGLDLSRVLSVPADGLGHDGVLAAAGVLVDGVDVLLLTSQAAGCLATSSRRRLLVRARERGTLILTPLPWQGARTLVCERSRLDEAAPGRPAWAYLTRCAVTCVRWTVARVMTRVRRRTAGASSSPCTLRRCRPRLPPRPPPAGGR